MIAIREFYYDDLVIYTDENLKTCSVGLVTKEKPYSPALLNTIKSNEILNEEKKETEDKHESSKDIITGSYNSLYDDDSSSDGNLYDPPQKEMVNVSWFIHKYISQIADRYDNTFIETIPGYDLQLYDRKLEISDIVKLDIDGKIKVGTVFNVKMKADVVILGHNKIIKNVDCSRMKWIEPLMGKNLETNYSYDSWLGEVLETSLEVIIRFSDGARLKIPDSLLSDFTNKISTVWNPEVILEGCIMEGNAQDLKSRKTKFIFETSKYNSKWLMKLKQEEIVQILVEKATPTSANMQWVFGYGDKNGIVVESPPHTLKGKELEKLEPVHPYLWHCLTVGDIWYYQLEEGDKIMQLDSEDELFSIVYKMINNEIDNCSELIVGEGDLKVTEPVPVNHPASNQICAGCVVKPRKKVLCNIKSRTKRKQILSLSMAKSDSSSSTDLSSSDTELGDDNNNLDQGTEKENPCAKDKQPNHFNILSGQSLNRIRPDNFVPVGILLTKSMVDVSWQDGTVSYNVPSSKLNPQLYNIDEHEFFPGDFVEQKFDPLSPHLAEQQGQMHNFGTVLSANSKDRVAKVQWFDYLNNSESANHVACVIKSGEAEEIGVYDISALNEHHFVLGQEVLIKQEAAYKNYPAGYVTRLEPNDGLLVIRWPDGKEIPISPTDLLLTVESVIGGGSESSDESGASEFSDDLSLELQSDSDSSGWETVEEIETTQSDESYLSKLICARKDFYELLEKINKVKAILNSVTEFTEILQSKLPLHVSQMLSVKDIFKMARTSEDNKSPIHHVNISFPEQQMAIRTLYEIRQNIGNIYKQCNDVGIKRMFECYRPKEFLSFRNIKNFIVSNAKFKYETNLKNNDIGSAMTDQNEIDFLSSSQTDNAVTDDMEVPNGCVSISNEILLHGNNEENPNTVIGDYLVTQYQNICSQLQYLQESIEVWLAEKSCYYNEQPRNEENTGTAQEEKHHASNGVVNDTSLVAPVDNLIGERTDNEVFDETAIAQNDSDREQLLSLSPAVIDDKTNQVLSGADLVKADFSERTLSTCEPIPVEHRGQFMIIDSAPTSHKFINSNRPSFSNAKFSRAWKRDINLLSTSLPRGVIVKSFDDRIDLFSVMIVGPSGTPYQHALFFFDIQLGAQYPSEPPSVFYISLASERVNPNLYTEGRVCLSLLGTWNGKGTENWDSKVSSLLQLIVSLQGLILVSEPYYNEAGFEIRKGSEEGKENSQRYNENAINNISQSMINLLYKPIPVFDKEIRDHFQEFGNRLVEIHDLWSRLNEENLTNKSLTVPDFPLAPVSKGFQLSIQRNVLCLRKALVEKSALTGPSSGGSGCL